MKWFHTTLTIANLRIYVEVSGATRLAAKQKLVDIIGYIREDKQRLMIDDCQPCMKEDGEADR